MAKFEYAYYVAESQEQAEKIQTYLFSQGYKWEFRTGYCPFAAPYPLGIFTDEDGNLTWASGYCEWSGVPRKYLVDGLRSRSFALNSRIKEIVEAMTRYVNAQLTIPVEWTQELYELQGQLAAADLPKV
jgi:hypothetical protein